MIFARRKDPSRSFRARWRGFSRSDKLKALTIVGSIVAAVILASATMVAAKWRTTGPIVDPSPTSSVSTSPPPTSPPSATPGASSSSSPSRTASAISASPTDPSGQDVVILAPGDHQVTSNGIVNVYKKPAVVGDVVTYTRAEGSFSYDPLGKCPPSTTSDYIFSCRLDPAKVRPGSYELRVLVLRKDLLNRVEEVVGLTIDQLHQVLAGQILAEAKDSITVVPAPTKTALPR